jgi:hypothetical protein
VGDTNHSDDDSAVFDLVDHAAVADSKSQHAAWMPSEGTGTSRPRIPGKPVDRCEDSPRYLLVQLAQFA